MQIQQLLELEQCALKFAAISEFHRQAIAREGVTRVLLYDLLEHREAVKILGHGPINILLSRYFPRCGIIKTA